MFVLLHGEDPKPIMDKLQKIFGIHSLSLAIMVDNDLEKIKEAALYALKENTDVKNSKCLLNVLIKISLYAHRSLIKFLVDIY